jgi:hypothetical protein
MITNVYWSSCQTSVSLEESKNQLDATQWFIEPYESLNIFRALLCPSSGACDYTDGPSVWHLTLFMAGCWSGAWL